MPKTLNTVDIKVKDPSTGNFIPITLLNTDTLSSIEDAKDAAINAIELKGQTTIASIPNDYTSLNNGVNDIKTQLDIAYSTSYAEKTTGAGIEIGKFYASYGKTYDVNCFNLKGANLTIYEFLQGGTYTTLVFEDLNGATSYNYRYTPTQNVDYLRVYVGNASPNLKGGQCVIFNYPGENFHYEIEELKAISDENTRKINTIENESLLKESLILGRINANNEIVPGTTGDGYYVAPSYFPIKTNKNYKLSFKINKDIEKPFMYFYIAIYDSNKTLVSRTQVTEDLFVDVNDNISGFYFTASQNGYARAYIAVGSESTDDVIVVEVEEANPIKLLLCGDSICRGVRNNYQGFGGSIGYPYKNIGIGDATIANVTNKPNIYQELIDENNYEPDIIICDGGINDYFYNAPMGNEPTAPALTTQEATTLDKTTFCGALSYLFYLMITKFPFAKRIFVITHKTFYTNTSSASYGYCPSRTNSAGYTQKDIHDKIVNIGKLYGVVIADVYNDGIIDTGFEAYVSPVSNSDDSTTANNYYVDNDGVHPMGLGYKEVYNKLVKSAIKQCMN